MCLLYGLTAPPRVMHRRSKKHLFFNVFKTEAISEQNDKIITFSMIKKYKLKLNKINIHNEKVHKNDSSHGFKTQAKTEKNMKFMTKIRK